MKKKKIIIFISILVILSLISLIIINIVRNNKLTNDNIEIISENYEELITNVNTYNSVRSSLSKLLNDFIYEKYMNNHDEYIDVLTKYNNVIEKIDQNINKINDRCKVIYKDKDINKMCNSYKKSYEKIINLYISDINNYNNKITSYNEYKKEDISLFKLIHKEYIDYDGDSVYEGKVN